ncbi:MAG TPA: vitamin K epoxide reductase family protein [Verrucomicrobiae bacterium]|nr:vitamin K epoxide reductase family protein [Verrucomicrobiae bacterium]
MITVLCGVGLYASLFMLAKTRRAEQGRLLEASVVQTPRARLYGVSNALLGAVYYPAVALGIWLLRAPWALVSLLIIVGFAALTSLVLAYSLLFVTRRPCPYCWTAHAINWSLAALCFCLIKNIILFGASNSW